MQRYKVMEQFGTGKEGLIAEFKKETDAKVFIAAKLAADAAMNVKVVYRLYDMDELLSEHDATQNAGAGAAQEAQGKGSASGFRPNPFNTVPTPPGSPKKWQVGDEEDKNK